MMRGSKGRREDDWEGGGREGEKGREGDGRGLEEYSIR